MNVYVTRRWQIPAPPGGEAGTIGTLRCDWGLTGYSLEDEVRVDPDPSTPQNEAKVYGKTAIPVGVYRLALRYSPHFKRDLPHMEDVPGFTETMLHGANTPLDVKGCIGVGHRRTPTGIADCAGVVDEIVAQLRAADQREEDSFLTVVDAFRESGESDPPGSAGFGGVTG